MTASGAADGPVHLAYIDALRGWAFLAVMTVHLPQCVPIPPTVERLLYVCSYGVQLFYVVSALTLFMSFEARVKRDLHPIRAFCVRRFFRIAPLFWLAVIVYSMAYGLGPRESAPEGIGWPHILATVLFVHGWHPTSINSVVPGGWSIAVEMNFYMLLPLCYHAFRGLRRSIVGCLLALLGTVVISVLTRNWLYQAFPESYAGLIDRFTYYWLPRQFAVFTIGFVLHAALVATRSWELPFQRLLTARTLLLVAFGALAILTVAGDRVPLGYFTTSCAFAILALALSQRPVRLIVNPLVCYVGKVSFSAYLCHFIVIHAMNTLLNPAQTAWGTSPLGFPLVFCLVAAITLLISTVTYRAVEVPGQDLGRYVIRRLGYGAPSR